MKSYKPTTPSRRQMTTVEYREFLTKSKPHKALTMKLKQSAGRNNQGRITTRHQGGGLKRVYRIVDFKQDKLDIPGKVESIEYDPYRTAFIALILYRDGDRRYILATKTMKAGDEVIASEKAALKEGNRTLLKNVPVGYFVHNIELKPNGGGRIARSAGNSCQILAQEDRYTHLKMPSGEVRMVINLCWASLGELSNPQNNLVTIGKAGKSRLLGVRPTVRGSAMNPRDHPYGGGEGRAKRGTRRPKTMWGKITGGRKTRRKKKWSNTVIVSRRKKK